MSLFRQEWWPKGLWRHLCQSKVSPSSMRTRVQCPTLSGEAGHDQERGRHSPQAHWPDSLTYLGKKSLDPRKRSVLSNKAETHWRVVPKVDLRPLLIATQVQIDKHWRIKPLKGKKINVHMLLPVIIGTSRVKWLCCGNSGVDQHFLWGCTEHSPHLTSECPRKKGHTGHLHEGLVLTIHSPSFPVSKHLVSSYFWRTCSAEIGQPWLWATELNYDIRV